MRPSFVVPVVRTLVVGGAALVVVMSAGGGGRDPLAALAWQLMAVVLLAGIVWLPRSLEARRASRALAFLVLVVLASAFQADRSEASLEQALAWLLALVPAAAVAAGARHLETGRSFVDRCLVAASASFLLLQAAGLAGFPLLGTAGGVGRGRPIGTFFDPNHLAACLAIVAAIHAPRAGLRGGRWPLAHLGLALVAGGSAVATTSRIALVAIAALVVVETWRRWREAGRQWPRHARPLLALIALFFVAAAAWVAWQRRGDPEAWSRTHIWRGALPAITERPLLGLGPAGFQSEWPRFQQPVERGLTRTARIASTPHGEWLRLPIELGLLGILALGVTFALVIAGGSGGALRQAPLLAAVIPLLLVHDAFHAPAFVAWFALGLGLAWAESRPSRGLAEGASPRLGAAAILALGLLAATCVRVTVSQRLLERAIASGDAEPLRRSLALEPRDVEALLMASDVAASAGPRGRLRALAFAEEATRLAPRDAEAALQRARVLAAMRRDSAGPAPVGLALEAYRATCALAPFDAWRAAEAAAVLSSAGEPAEALTFARAALAIEPHLARGRAWAIVALEDLGRIHEAALEREALIRDLSGEGKSSPENARVLEIEASLLEAAGAASLLEAAGSR